MNTGINRIRLEFKEVQKEEPQYKSLHVLIESDWNLKTFTCSTAMKVTRINRIRLEFKDYHFIRKLCCYAVLIESDWNLKSLPV